MRRMLWLYLKFIKRCARGHMMRLCRCVLLPSSHAYSSFLYKGAQAGFRLVVVVARFEINLLSLSLSGAILER